MATDNHNENNQVATSNLKADRQYLVDSGTNRLIMTLLLVGGITLMGVLLFLAAWGKTGRYTDPDRTQYEATLNNAAAMLEGGAVAPDNAARVTLPIDTAIRAVADKGLGTITGSLKQTGTPPAPAQVAPVEEVMPTEEVAPVETTEAMTTEVTETTETTETTEIMTTEVVEAVEAVEATEVAETVVAEVVETVETTEVMTTTETAPAMAATAATAGVAAATTAVTNTVTETVEAPASTVVTTTAVTAPAVEATTTTEATTVSTSSQTITANTTVVSGSTLTMSNGMTVQINKDVYNACVVCHQVNGQGIITVFPPLANHAAKLFNQDRNYLPNVVLYGIEGEINVAGLNYNEPMRGYPDLSDEDIAGVLNYVLTTWGNETLLSEDFQPYEASEIASLRGQELGPDAVQAIRAGMNLN